MKKLLAILLIAGAVYAYAGQHLDNGHSFAGVTHNGASVTATTQLQQVAFTITGGVSAGFVWNPSTGLYDGPNGMTLEFWSYQTPEGGTIYFWTLKNADGSTNDWGQMS